MMTERGWKVEGGDDDDGTLFAVLLAVLLTVSGISIKLVAMMAKGISDDMARQCNEPMTYEILLAFSWRCFRIQFVMFANV